MAKSSSHVLPIGERLDACNQFNERVRKRFTKTDVELLKFQTERAQLVTELAEGQARFEGLRAVAGAKPPFHPAAQKDVGPELERMQGVIDDLPREQSSWTGGRHGGPASVTEVSIPMDLGTIVDPRLARMEALIDEARGKRPRVGKLSSSVCRQVRKGAPPDTA